MGRRRKTSRRKTYGRRRKSTSSTARAALRLARKIQKREYAERQEMRRGAISTLDTTLGLNRILNNTEDGDSEAQRHGDDHTGIRCVITLDFTTTAEPSTSSWYRRARVIVYNVKSSVGGTIAALTWDQLLNSTAADPSGITPLTTWSSLEADMCTYNRNNVPGNVEILKDMLVKIDMDNPQAQRRMIIPFKKQVRQTAVTGLSDYVFTNQLFLMIIPLDVIPSPSAGQLLVTWSSVYSFYE